MRILSVLACLACLFVVPSAHAAPKMTMGRLLRDLVRAYEKPYDGAAEKLEGEAGVLSDPLAMAIVKNWEDVYLNPAYTLLCHGKDLPALLPIPDPSRHAFVVLGYALKNGEMTDELKGRCEAAAEAARAFPDAILVCSGGATGSNNRKHHTEAGLMKQYLVNTCHIEESRIFTDETALDTAANARNTYAILYQQGMETLTLVTSSYHQRWGEVLYHAVGLQYAQSLGYETEIIGNFCYDVQPSIRSYRHDARYAALQLADILGLSSSEKRLLPQP
ncbi:MAG: YdcF family protein [Clostridia bacterium]|nr:YdcF family protein [Clostridia bacterium]